MGQQFCHADYILLFITCNYAQIFLLPLFAETEGILKSNNAATDEVFKNLMSMVITSSLVEKEMNAFSWFIRFFMHVSFNGKHAPDRETVFPVRVKKATTSVVASMLNRLARVILV
jgi:hypothetical protein